MHVHDLSRATIDAKRRLAIPLSFRLRMEPGSAVYVSAEPPGLRLYPEAMVHKLAAAHPTLGGRILVPDEAEAARPGFTPSARLELDAAGRISLPEGLLKVSGLQQQVMVIGCGATLLVINAGEPVPADLRSALEAGMGGGLGTG